MTIHKTIKENAQFVELKYRVVVKIIEKDPDTGEPIGDPIRNTNNRVYSSRKRLWWRCGFEAIHKIQNGTCNSSASRQLSIYKKSI